MQDIYPPDQILLVINLINLSTEQLINLINWSCKIYILLINFARDQSYQSFYWAVDHFYNLSYKIYILRINFDRDQYYQSSHLAVDQFDQLILQDVDPSDQFWSWSILSIFSLRSWSIWSSDPARCWSFWSILIVINLINLLTEKLINLILWSCKM
jgi:hypothetical protein